MNVLGNPAGTPQTEPMNAMPGAGWTLSTPIYPEADMSGDPISSCYLEADISCYHCGDTVGLLRRVNGTPGAPMIFLDRAHGGQSVVRRLTDLRCARCRGPLYPSAVELRRDDGAVDLQYERPRPGRPRKLAG